MKKMTTFFVLIVILCSTPAITTVSADSAESTDEEKSPVFEPLNTQDLGHFSGRVQLLLMRRNFDHQDASSGTLATTLGYVSPDRYPVQVGLTYIHSARLFEGGSLNPPEGGAYPVLNDRFSILQEAYLKWKLDDLGLSDSHFVVGRKNSDYDFAPTFAIRQKPQGLEGLFLHLGQWEDFSIDVGHIERFSSWGGRNEGSDYLHHRYQKIEDVVAAHDGISAPGGASSMQFVNLDAQPLPWLDLTVYDLYGYNLYNTFGLKTATTLQDGENGDLVWKKHLVVQNDVGNYNRALGEGLDATALETSLALTRGDFMLEPGLFSVFSDDDLRHPTESSLTWENTLSWFTRAYAGNSNSAFLKGTYTLGDTSFYAMWFGTKHHRSVGGGAFDQEIDIVISHDFTDNLSAAIKAGYGHQDNRGGRRDSDREDMRLFVTYSF